MCLSKINFCIKTLDNHCNTRKLTLKERVTCAKYDYNKKSPGENNLAKYITSEKGFFTREKISACCITWTDVKYLHVNTHYNILPVESF